MAVLILLIKVMADMAVDVNSRSLRRSSGSLQLQRHIRTSAVITPGLIMEIEITSICSVFTLVSLLLLSILETVIGLLVPEKLTHAEQ